jgi:release factor glutamine methyltransferase
VEGAGRVLETGGLIALEVGVDQAGKVADRIRAAPGYAAPMVLRDLAGRDRILLARWTGDE